VTSFGSLLGVFALLSLLAVGGGTAVLPEMKAMTVSRLSWLTADQFVTIYSLGQLAPGPNMLMVSVIGYHVAAQAGLLAGLAGALIALAGFLLPSSLLAFGVNRLWGHFEGSPWRTAIQRGLAPMAIGLMAAGVIAIGKVATRDITTLAMAALVTAICCAATSIPPSSSWPEALPAGSSSAVKRSGMSA
jgi:chromate transporter